MFWTGLLLFDFRDSELLGFAKIRVIVVCAVRVFPAFAS
jgi:hypothetical protein